MLAPYKKDPRLLSATPLCECKGIKILNSATRNKTEVISEIIQMLLHRGSHLRVSIITALPITFKCGPQSKKACANAAFSWRPGAGGSSRPPTALRLLTCVPLAPSWEAAGPLLPYYLVGSLTL